jgi:hypothetical protein
MGRLMFSYIIEQVQVHDSFAEPYKLYLYGSSGGGKSHLLAALVCHLVREGKRVVYIPDCRELVESPIQRFRDAFLFAFHDKAHLHARINNARTLQDLVDFAMKQPRFSFYLVIDQRNALDEQPSTSERKIAVNNFLAEIKSFQKYIFSASANEVSAREADTKMQGITTMFLHGGMTEVCPYPLQAISSHIV